MDLKDIKAIIDLMRKNNLSEFELERQEFKIKLKRAAGALPVAEEPVITRLLPPLRPRFRWLPRRRRQPLRLPRLSLPRRKSSLP